MRLPRFLSRKVLKIINYDLARVLLRYLMVINGTEVHPDRLVVGRWYARREEMFGYGTRFGFGWTSTKSLE